MQFIKKTSLSKNILGLVIKFTLLTTTKIPKMIAKITTNFIMIFSGFIELPILVFL